MKPDQEMRDILRQMRLLSEVGAGSLVPLHSAGKPGTKPPPGYRENRDSTKPPDPNFSLYEHFSYRYERAGSDLHKRVIVCQARVALRERLQGPEPWRLERADRSEDEEIEILIRDGEGVHVAELAAQTSWPRSWIETQRERNGREPTYGRTRPSWHALSRDDRRLQALTLAQEGLSLRRAAKQLGVAHTTLSRYWPKTRDDGTYVFEEAA